uniref:DUF2252 domain-containing protein n=1 Tax=Aplanochytrium stocchinoi TaxID=215587 RepID=A0A7S3PI57_9STRA
MMCADPEYRGKVMNVPRVISNGDCHPENFGVMVQANGNLNWGVNDFDQAFNAPFTWDLKRGATGFMLACLVRNQDLDACSKTTANFVKMYLEVFEPERQCKVSNEERFIEDSEAEDVEQNRVIKELFKEARSIESEKETLEWLKKKGVDPDKNRFFQTDEVFPLPDSKIEEFQESVDAYLFHGVPALVKYPYLPDKDGNTFWTVQAVAAKEKSGTGSIGLNRYLLLIKGRNEKYGRIILEMKAEAKSVLENYFRYHVSEDQEAKRAVDAETAAWPYTNLFYGWTRYKNKPYIIREKSKHAVTADLEEMSDADFYSYAGSCGQALSFYHIRARCANAACKTSDMAYVDVETCEDVQKYLQQYSSRDGKSFKEMIVQFAIEESKRQLEAWSLLKSWVNRQQASGGNILQFLTGGL